MGLIGSDKAASHRHGVGEEEWIVYCGGTGGGVGGPKDAAS